MLPFLKWIELAQLHRKKFRLFDWLCAIAMLGYAAYAKSWGWAFSGAITVVVAWWDPAGRVPGYIQSRIVKRPRP